MAIGDPNTVLHSNSLALLQLTLCAQYFFYAWNTLIITTHINLQALCKRLLTLSESSESLGGCNEKL